MLRVWTEDASDEDRSCQATDGDVQKRIKRLIAAIRREPVRCEGKPEPLRAGPVGWLSRRITDEHRLVGRVKGAGDEQVLIIAQFRLR